MRRLYTILILLVCFASMLNAQKVRFCNLTADEVKIDSVIPHVAYNYKLPDDYQDSVYTAVLKYPEFIDMLANDVAAYKAITDELPPAMPSVLTAVVYSKKKATMLADFSPVVYRDGKYQFLVSFMIEFASAPANVSHSKIRKADGKTPASRYAEHSVLSSGTWAKIRVSQSGMHQLTKATIANAGFSDISKVKIYGYGGNTIPESLTDEYLREHDDLREIPTYQLGDKKIFYANGPVTWESKDAQKRKRNPYSDYGYYLITQSDDAPLTVSEEEFVKENYPKVNDYHSLFEKDEYAWRKGGQTFVEQSGIAVGASREYPLEIPEGNTTAKITVVATGGSKDGSYEVYVNDSLVAVPKISFGTYDRAQEATSIFTLKNVLPTNKIKIKNRSVTGLVRLDYISASFEKPWPMQPLNSDELPSAEYVHNITNQDLHAHTACDMVIIIPTSQNTLKQATALKEMHERRDSMTVRIVPADEIYNEFASGTPDVSAYKRYLKMLYDRATIEKDLPKYVLLFGDCLWDNRHKTASTASFDANNFLLCYESENSYSDTECYVSDDFIGLLDDNETIKTSDYITGMPDIAIGRIPVTNPIDAQTVVDKTIYYAEHSHEAAWQNTIMFLGDDGNNNIHMRDIDAVAEEIGRMYPGYYTRKVMWDAFERISSASGNRYPEATSIIKKQQNDGALIIDYGGHGSEAAISHEYVLTLHDFNEFRGSNYSFWITASCEIMPFDGVDETIGESALLNSKGGSIGFFGTTRTVLSSSNKHANRLYMMYVLSSDENGNFRTIGEANRLTKDSLVLKSLDRTVNKLQFSLLGDPALKLARPQMTAVVDSINGYAINNVPLAQVKAGSIVSVKGHIESNGTLASGFNGFADIMMRDSKQFVKCKLNDTSKDGATSPFTYYDRSNVIYQGTDSVVNGNFSFIMAVPKDINYSDEQGMINIYAYNKEKTISAHGATDRFIVGGSETASNDSIGPSVWCYLNSPDFTNGGIVNPTPYFYAEIQDEDGINASGAGIGHDMQLTIDGLAAQTYSLNDNFKYDFGSYTAGSTYYSIPKLAEGPHTLRFRAWDVKNNCTQVTLNFVVKSDLTPNINAMYVTPNPASDSVKFIVAHDCPGNSVEVSIDVMDAAGRLLWTTSETTATSDMTYATTWDLTLDTGAKLQTGVYLYRVRIFSDAKKYTSKAKKLVVVRK